MKTLKLAAFALALGFFAASCGGGEKTEETPVDTTVVAEPMPETPVATETTPADTTVKTTTTTTDTTVKK